ncbi:DUF255 domain-containing protein [Actomonas aquatica]|uniref:DUF255 domain-containing protein n=1 Tax=Actomonas aquatica TaxID=2866162 RepID=A0ABZ1CDN7_9BACT|nr:DUF255 domain-containing protein [Opitutus sp. WL0086]WRQ89536.1 DUF255 domain-containing protein [Opitutus sp. WL0086]
MISHRSLLTSALLAISTLSATAAVDWLDSLDAGQAAATERNLPLYLHIGDPLNELTGAMARQTFANDEVSAFLNEHFVCVHLNRDDAPALAGFGQQWLAADQKLPGWPLNLWFTPDLQPIEGASYLPPTEEWGREGFMVVAGRIAERWGADAESVQQGTAATQRLIADYLPFAAEPPADLDAALATAASDWLARYNAELGTFGEAPHGIEPELIRFLIARGGDARATALASLKARILSPLRDPIDGGFYRATADSEARLPVFQKRLTDQARIALACMDAAAVSDDPIYAAAAKSALDYAINRLSPVGDGTFVIGEDATAPESVAHQTWLWNDLVALVGEDMATALGARADGNVNADEDLEGHHAGRNVLDADPITMRPQHMFDLRAKVLFARADFAAVVVDHTATAAAHALMYHAMKRSEAELGDLDHGAYALGTKAALLRDFSAGTEFFSRTSRSEVPATPEDYVLTALAFEDPALAAAVDEKFYDDELGLYYVTSDEVLGLRPLWWTPGAGDLPAPTVWRVMLGNAPALMVDELTLPFENPDVPPAGAVLLALQQTLN